MEDTTLRCGIWPQHPPLLPTTGKPWSLVPCALWKEEQTRPPIEKTWSYCALRSTYGLARYRQVIIYSRDVAPHIIVMHFDPPWIVVDNWMAYMRRGWIRWIRRCSVVEKQVVCVLVEHIKKKK